MKSMTRLLVVLGAIVGIALTLGVNAQQAPGDGPRYANGNNLLDVARQKGTVKPGF